MSKLTESMADRLASMEQIVRVMTREERDAFIKLLDKRSKEATSPDMAMLFTAAKNLAEKVREEHRA